MYIETIAQSSGKVYLESLFSLSEITLTLSRTTFTHHFSLYRGTYERKEANMIIRKRIESLNFRAQYNLADVFVTLLKKYIFNVSIFNDVGITVLPSSSCSIDY